VNFKKAMSSSLLKVSWERKTEKQTGKKREVLHWKSARTWENRVLPCPGKQREVKR
jgi:hypothetical protein